MVKSEGASWEDVDKGGQSQRQTTRQALDAKKTPCELLYFEWYLGG